MKALTFITEGPVFLSEDLNIEAKGNLKRVGTRPAKGKIFVRPWNNSWAQGIKYSSGAEMQFSKCGCNYAAIEKNVVKPKCTNMTGSSPYIFMLKKSYKILYLQICHPITNSHMITYVH